jgi:hypothetical protein
MGTLMDDLGTKGPAEALQDAHQQVERLECSSFGCYLECCCLLLFAARVYITGCLDVVPQACWCSDCLDEIMV